MEEALEILWTYARREPLDSNGETVVPTINNSIAAIRIIMRLEGWGSEKRKVNSEKRATPAYAMSDKPAHGCMGKVSKNEVGKPFTQYNTNNDDENNYDYDEDNDNKGELLTYSALADFTPTPAQHQYPQPNTAYNNYTAGASLQLVPQENLLSFTRHTLPAFAPAPFHLAYYEVLTRFAMGEIKKLMITMPPQHGKSEGATRRLPAFVLGQDPDKRIAIVSYNAIKARKFNRELQRIMDDDHILRTVSTNTPCWSGKLSRTRKKKPQLRPQLR